MTALLWVETGLNFEDDAPVTEQLLSAELMRALVVLLSAYSDRMTAATIQADTIARK